MFVSQACLFVSSCAGGNKEVAVLPDGSRRRFDDLISHTKEIIQDSCRIRAFVAFFGVLQDCFRGEIPPKADVLDIYGRIVTNSFNIMNEEFQSIGVGLYLQASALDHSCRPNATVCFEGRHCIVRTLEDTELKPLREAFTNARISYCNLLNPTAGRRKILREQYYFHCECEACLEGDTGLEAKKVACMRCPACSTGIAVDEAKREAIKCLHCHLEVPSDHTAGYWRLRDEIIEKIYKNVDGHPEPMEELGRDYLNDMCQFFHPCEKYYFDVLEAVFEVQLNNGQWGEAIDSGRELLVAYQELYPRYDTNTGLLLLKLAKMELLLGKFLEAYAHVKVAFEHLCVTYGEGHPFVKSTVLDLRAEIESEVKEIHKEERQRTKSPQIQNQQQPGAADEKILVHNQSG